MNVYENIVILNAAINDEEMESALSKIKDLITSNGGEVLKIDVWGRRKLAYEINKHKKGLYVLLFFKTSPTTIKKLEDFYKVFDVIVKYMIIKLSHKQAQDLGKVEVAAETIEQKKEA